MTVVTVNSGTGGISLQGKAHIKKIHPYAEIPKYHTTGAAGFDIPLVENCIIPPGEVLLARTGLIIAAPKDHMLLLVPRSSTWRRYSIKLANTVGIVDEDYCGDNDELVLALLNAGDKTKTLMRGMRLIQGIFVPITRVDFCEVQSMGESRGGFGVTGE